METKKCCGNCIHFHPYNTKKVPKHVTPMDGYCGLGKHNRTDVPDCKVYAEEKTVKPSRKERQRMREDAKVQEMREADRITGTKGRFMSNPWKNYLK